MADEQTMTDLKDLAGAVEGTVAAPISTSRGVNRAESCAKDAAPISRLST